MTKTSKKQIVLLGSLKTMLKKRLIQVIEK